MTWLGVEVRVHGVSEAVKEPLTDDHPVLVLAEPDERGVAESAVGPRVAGAADDDDRVVVEGHQLVDLQTVVAFPRELEDFDDRFSSFDELPGRHGHFEAGVRVREAHDGGFVMPVDRCEDRPREVARCCRCRHGEAILSSIEQMCPPPWLAGRSARGVQSRP
jgi:hypothetical protein